MNVPLLLAMFCINRTKGPWANEEAWGFYGRSNSDQ